MKHRLICMEGFHMKCVDLKNRVVAAAITVGIVFSFSACKDAKKNDSGKVGRKETSDVVVTKKDTDKTDPTDKDKATPVPPVVTSVPVKSIDEIKSIDGPMLAVGCENVGPFDYYEDECRGCTYLVYYNGQVERISEHSMSDPVEATAEIPDDALFSFYEFCLKYGDGKAFAGYSEDVCDGTMYYFTYFDERGQRHDIYGGYCYAVDVLMDIVDRVGAYFDPDFSIPCQNRIGGYQGLLDTVTNLSCPQIRRIDQLPDDVVLEAGVDLKYAKYFYEYTYTTTEDADKGPIVCYVSNIGVLVAMKNNRNWDVTDLIIEVNGRELHAQWDPATYNTYPLAQMLSEQNSITVEMDDWDFGKEGYVKDLKRNGPLVNVMCKPGQVVMCMTSTGNDVLRIVTRENECKCVTVATINSVTEEELLEIFGEGPVTVTISIPAA